MMWSCFLNLDSHFRGVWFGIWVSQQSIFNGVTCGIHDAKPRTAWRARNKSPSLVFDKAVDAKVLILTATHQELLTE